MKRHSEFALVSASPVAQFGPLARSSLAHMRPKILAFVGAGLVFLLFWKLGTAFDVFGDVQRDFGRDISIGYLIGPYLVRLLGGIAAVCILVARPLHWSRSLRFAIAGAFSLVFVGVIAALYLSLLFIPHGIGSR